MDVFTVLKKYLLILVVLFSSQPEVSEPGRYNQTEVVSYTHHTKLKVPSGGRIIGGKPASYGAYPFFARVIIEDEYACGGTIISKYEVLTAAHCVCFEKDKWLQVNDIKVRTGDFTIFKYDERDSTQTHSIQKYKYFPQFDGDNIPQGYDVVILITEHQIDFDEYRQPFQTFCIDEDPQKIGTRKLKAIGLGRIDYEYFGQFPDDLMEVTLTEVQQQTCIDEYEQPDAPNSVVCMESTYGKDTCKGDSGGPLFEIDPQNGQHVCLYAVTSYGPDDESCATGVPAVYARLSYYMPKFKYESQISASSALTSLIALDRTSKKIIWMVLVTVYAFVNSG